MSPEPGLVAGFRQSDRADFTESTTADRPPAQAPLDVVSSPTDADPAHSGWTAAAMAVHALRQMSRPVTLVLHVDDHPEILIDLALHAFASPLVFADFPAHPDAVAVETRPVAPGAPPPFELPGRQLDPLLFSIGSHAFADRRAPWLHADDRFRLRRWPNLAELALTLDQVRMTAMLGNGFGSIAELADAARTDEADARRLVNAFAVMGILRSSSAAAAAMPAGTAEAGAAPALASRAAAALPEHPHGGSLLSRLRDRFAR